MQSIGRDTAIALAKTRWWIDKTPRQICDIQLFTEELCMDVGDFMEALGKSLNRSVYTHEIALNYDGLIAEYLGERPAPSLDDIVNLLTSTGKPVIIDLGEPN